jgi:murein DD-endopeptidase MepM/ murein hydrolase activator NlpD
MKFFLSFLLIFFCLSCSQKPAKIVNHSKSTYSKNSELNKRKYRDFKQNFERGEKQKNQRVEIAAGDTIYNISKKYQVAIHDLIKQNNLTPPYNLKSGDKIVIPVPNYHEVKSGDTLYGISRDYGMKIDNIIEINNLKEPYNLKAGQRIKISKFIEDDSPNMAEKKSAEDHSSEQKEKSVSFIEKTLDKFNHFSWPVRGAIISKFGPKSGGLYNDGINIKAKEGSEVKSSEDGIVGYVGNELKGYGNLVIIKHSGGWITAYAHLASSSVKRGQKLEKGQKIGTVGTSGNVSSPQLYFGLRKGRDAVNPENYLR